jgi:hypothetical protein
MFIGHFAVGLAAKKAAPNVSLGTLFLSVQLLDLMWPIFLLLGIEHVRINVGDTAFTPLDLYDYPISHSLVTVFGWSLLFALIYYVLKKCPKGAWVLAIGVFSHWLLDFITHRPDMPITPGATTYVGLGLWNSVVGTVLVEGALFLVGVIIYARATVATDKTGKYAFWSLIAFLSIMWVVNMVGPPPPDSQSLAYFALLMWLFVPWGYWIDRHRKGSLSSLKGDEERI